MCSILHISMFYMRVWAGGFGIVWDGYKKASYLILCLRKRPSMCVLLYSECLVVPFSHDQLPVVISPKRRNSELIAC